MNLVKDWTTIRRHFNKSFRSNLHVSIASINKDNHPTVTPIGSFFLNNDQNGFYFEMYSTKLPLHSKKNKNICVLAVDSNKWFWFRSLFFVKFKTNPAIKLYGQLGQRREATDFEINRLDKRTKLTKGLKGNAYLWKKGTYYVREIKFNRVEKINLGKMTKHL